jgi:signal transduction histidine kinase
MSPLSALRQLKEAGTRTGRKHPCDSATPPSGFAELQRWEQQRSFAAMMISRILVVPVMVMIAAWYWRSTHDAAISRRLIAVGGLAMLICAADFIVCLRHGIQRHSVAFTQGSHVAFQIALCATTGGLASPFVALYPVFTVVSVIVMERPAAIIGTFSNIASLVVMALVPITAGPHPFPLAALMCAFVLLSANIGIKIRFMHERMLRGVLCAREEALRTHAEQLQSLTTLSGEIAHELKTPLASIKGLTGLALMELDDPARARERLGVQRREVERMQRILDEFLNFSRPLTPLSQEDVDVRRLCTEVLDLYEGLAREREIRTGVLGESCPLHGDPRKVKQILINLVQNAFEANPRGGEIHLELAAIDERVTVRVLDRGPGLPGPVASRIFEAGVTTKSNGSGLGLTIARMLAEQHGGSLALGDREGGGCIAELQLPAAGPAHAASEAA